MGGWNEFQYGWMEEDVVGWKWKGTGLEGVKWVGKGFAGKGWDGVGWDGMGGVVMACEISCRMHEWMRWERVATGLDGMR